MAAGTLAVTADARAESGRRICEYSFKARPRHSENPRIQGNPLLRVSLGLDYKKDGACPTLSTDKLVASGYVDADQVFPNAVPKWTCQDWGRTHQTYLTDLGADPCPEMQADSVYAFFWQDPTTPNAAKPSYLYLGHESVFM